MGWLEAVADPIRLAIVRYLAQHDSGSLSELADAASANRETARRHVRHLQQAGVVVAAGSSGSGHGPGRPPVRYRLAEYLRRSPALTRRRPAEEPPRASDAIRRASGG